MACQSHQVGTNLKDILHLIDREGSHLSAALRQDRHEAFALYYAQSLSHGRPTDAEGGRQIDFPQLLPWLEFVLDNGLTTCTAIWAGRVA